MLTDVNSVCGEGGCTILYIVKHTDFLHIESTGGVIPIIMTLLKADFWDCKSRISNTNNRLYRLADR